VIKDCPLGIFDSGIGGLTVLRKVLDELPCEDIIYLGDTARLPYGDKSPNAIIRYSLQNAGFLNAHNIKLLVVACNTASAYAVQYLREKYFVPIIDVIEPAVDWAVKHTTTKKIAILGTRATINSGVYNCKIKQILPDAEVTSLACPLFVPLVEEDFLSHPATELVIREYMQPILKKQIDTVILGCTHYPMLLPAIQKVLGPEIHIIDSASVCAKKVVFELEKQKLTRNLLQKGKRKYYASDDTEKFRRLGENFLGIPIDSVDSYFIESDR
jgi:glutamate racemase